MSDPGSCRSLPARPDRRFLKIEAKRRLAAGEFRKLHAAQFAIAREYGFTSWPRLSAHIDLLRATAAERADAFVRSACSSDPRAALALLAADRDITAASAAAALCAGDTVAVRHLDATKPLGPLGWPPLLYVTFSRLMRVSPRHAPGIRSCVAMLLERGADPSTIVDIEDDGGGADVGHRLTPIYGAVGVNNDLDTTLALLAAGADPDEGLGQADANDPHTIWGSEALYHACEFADPACLVALLDAHPHPIRVSYCLARALDHAWPEHCTAFLDHGADPNFRIPWQARWTHLHKAAANGQRTVLAEMLHRGADPTLVDDHGRSALTLAVRAGHDDIAMMLVEAGADPTTVSDEDRRVGQSGLGALFRAAGRGDVSAIRRALANGHDPNALADDDGLPLLQAAAVAGQAAVVRLLLEAGADPNVIGPYGANALGATRWASVNMFNAEGGTAARPVTDIDQTGYLQIVRLLLDAGVDVHNSELGSDEVRALLAAHDDEVVD
jgi:ankyrin repeat protein